MSVYGVFEPSEISLDGNSIPIIPGAYKVYHVTDDLYQAIGERYKHPQYGWTHYHYTTMYQDVTNNWIIGSESTEVLDSIGTWESLDDFVGNDPEEWEAYKCWVQLLNGDIVEIEMTLKDVDKMDKKLSKDKPYKYKDEEGDKIYIIGCQATIPVGCGVDFRPEEIELTTQWYGDSEELLLSVRGRDDKKKP